MKKTFLFVFILFILSSCFEFEELEFNGVENPKIEKIDGKNISLNLGVKIFNPNGFSIKVKPSQVDLMVDDQLLAKAYFDDKIKLVRKKEDTYQLALRLELEDGAMFKMLKYALKDKVKVRIVGFVKGSVLGISKKVKIDQIQEIDGKNFKMNSFLNKQ